ncbi:MAG: HD domain-containing protein, partial [Elusimicrobia bacterium]|nr:HD domain-containing protein [Elusimicrobiota bacterium]
ADPRRREGWREVEARLAEAGAAGWSVRARALAEDEEEARAETGDGRRTAQKAFFRAVSLVEEVMRRARAGGDVSFAPARRVVCELVDAVTEDEQALFELTTIHSFDEYTYAHCVNVCVYAVALGVRLGLDRPLLAELGFSALFHDLGKVKLPLALIDKPDEYDAADWDQMRLHPLLGAKLLLSMPRPLDRSLARAAAVAFEHHLGADASGYPRTRRERRQGLFSRVCAIADSFDALTSGRVYQRRPLGPAEALRRMVQRAGTAYDPLLLRLFVRTVGVFPIGTALNLGGGRIGVVWRNTPGDLLRPRVRVAEPSGETRVVELPAGALRA